MSEVLELSDDVLKVMVAQHGVRATARLLQMDETQMNTFRRRVARAGWMQEPEIAAMRGKLSPTVTAAPIVSKVSPTAALNAELQALGSKSRLSLARGIAKAGEHIESLDGAAIVADAGNVKSIAQTADLVHGWKDAAPQVKIRLDVLSGSAEAPIIDVAADVSDSWTEESASTDLDDY